MSKAFIIIKPKDYILLHNANNNQSWQRKLTMGHIEFNAIYLVYLVKSFIDIIQCNQNALHTIKISPLVIHSES